jgi:hypothetical protein
MVGPTAQIAALTCYFNARHRGLVASPFFPNNSTCQFCEWIHFLRPQRASISEHVQWDVVSRTPEEWIDSTASDGFSHALLVHKSVDDPRFSDRMSAGFVGGGGRWLLCVRQGAGSDCWQARWQTGHKDAADRRIWRVEYGLIAQKAAEPPGDASITEITAQMAESLAEIEAFARRNSLDGFAGCFSKAQNCLTADDPFSFVHHRDLAPEGTLPMAAARLLAACQAAWVFGGMGSWNDLGFEGGDQNLYERLSDQLYGFLNKAICAAVNASAKA